MDDRSLLRHGLAALAYRGGKVLRSAPESFARYDSGGGRTPLRILAHMSDLFDWALSMARGEERWNQTAPGAWSSEVARFYRSLGALDEFFGSKTPIQAEIPRLLAGPIADAFSHVGQLAMLRRMSGSPTVGESYYAADIVTGRVGPEQSPPRMPFKG